MDHHAISGWLRKKATHEAALSFVSGTFILAGGFVLVTITFFCAYAVVWFLSRSFLAPVSHLILDRPIGVPHGLNLAVSGGTIVLLFFANARFRRAYQRQSELRRTRADPSEMPASLVHLLAYPGASARSNADILFCGPRLVEIGLDHLKKGWRLRRMEAADCARVLAVLAARDSRVPLAELHHEADVPKLEEVCGQLHDLAGVVFVNLEPPGLSLTGDLRNELFRDLGIRPDRGTAPPPRNPFLFGSGEEQGPQRLGIGGLRSPSGGEDKGEGQFEGGQDAACSQDARRRVEAANAAYAEFLSRNKERQEGADPKVEGVWEQFKRTPSTNSGKAGGTRGQSPNKS